MKNLKKILAIGALVMAIGGTSVIGFADETVNLDNIKKDRIEMKKEQLNARVEAGTITQEQADEIIKAIEENQKLCDGTGTNKIGHKLGAKFGSNGLGQGKNLGGQLGQGPGQGHCGMRFQDGTRNITAE